MTAVPAKKVDKYLSSLIPQDTGCNSDEIPPCKREHLLCQLNVHYRAETAFREIPSAINAIGGTDNEYGDHHQGSIKDKLVGRRPGYQHSNTQTQESVKKTDICICGHPFMSRDRSHLRHTHKIDDKRCKRKMKYPYRSRNPSRIDGHPFLDEPQTQRFGKCDDDEGNGKLNHHSGRIYLTYTLSVTLTHFKGNETRYGGIESTGYDGEHGHDATYYIVDSEVILPQGIQNYSGCI